MDKPKLLSGHELVARGITKIDASLPEVGLKDVLPNGSWLEQKQIQSALEARKHIIEVERIEKSGVLSHAVWREELMLAEVTRNVGGHWQYLGHQVGKQLFLKPEEALFLIEVNCLKLTYNDVIVSMQQAYSLLLRSKISLLQYKVYASLSRVGYKVYRHEVKKLTDLEKTKNTTEKPRTELNTTNPAETSEEEVRHCDKNTHNEVKGDDAGTNNSHYQSGKESEIKTKKCEDDTNKIEKNLDTSVNGCHQNATELVTIPETAKLNVDGNTKTDAHEIREQVLVGNKGGNDSTTIDVDGGRTNDQDCDKTKETQCLNTIEKIINDDNTKVKINEDEEVNMTAESNCVSSTDCENNTHLVQNSQNENSKETNFSIIANNEETRSEIVDVIDISMNEVTTTSNCVEKKSNAPEESMLQPVLYHQHKIKMLENRKLRALNWKHTEKCFEKIPELSDKQTVMVNVPEDEYIPRKVFLNNISYMLNLDNIKSNTKNTRPPSSESRPYSANEEVNGDHIRRIKDTPRGNTPVTNPPPVFPHIRFNRPLYQNHWRPNINFFPYNFIFRSFLPSHFIPRFRVFSPRPPLLGMYPRFNSFQPNEQRDMPSVNKKRRNSAKQKEIHLGAIKNLATRLRHLVLSGNTQQENIDSLQRLINTFNAKYNMKLRLTDDFEVFNDETIVETITLDEDEEPGPKKAKTDDDTDKYKENFNKLKQLALKLKGLTLKGEVNSRHRRAFSSVIKKFNKSYNADVYFNNNFEVIDKRCINLDSSSDSDCVIEETAKSASSKKLKNPFNILKRLSEKQVSTSSDTRNGTISGENCRNYSTTTTERFSKNWLPSEDDFGRAEILPKHLMNSYLIESKREEYLFEFLKSQSYDFDSWLNIKLSFLKSFEDADVAMESDYAEVTSFKSLVEPDDSTDMPSVLKKLSIISNNKEVDSESSLNIDFDVYNRDVQNFRKSNPPKPHFRVICISESSGFPNGKEVAALHSKYDDDITIVFAVVGVGSISYLQINPINLPVYIPSNDFP